MLQLPMFAPEVTWEATPVAQLPSWQDAKRVAIDIETCDPQLTDLGCGVRRGGYIAGVAFAIEDGPEHYLPVAHYMGGNLDPAHVFAYLRDQCDVFTGDVVTNNGPYDHDYLWDKGVEFKRAKWHRDTQVAEPLLDENQYTYNLNDIAARHGLPGKDEDELRDFAKAYGIDPKRDLHKLPAGAAARYAMRDTRLPLEVLRRQETKLEAEGLLRAYDLESKMMLALLRMRRRGVLVDFDRLDQLEAWAKQIIGAEQERIREITGVLVAPSFANVTQLARALETCGVMLPRTATGKPSVTKDILATIDHPIAAAIKRGKEFAKLLGTYIAGVRSHVVNGKLHTTFHSLRHSKDDNQDGGDEESAGAAFGRCSSSNPNLQAQPIRNKEYGKKWRGIYRPRPGKKWWKGDFSQQEPRIFLSYAEQKGLPKAAEIAQLYRDCPSLDSYQPLCEISGLDRDTVKIMFLAYSYGAGRARMARQMKLPTAMAQKRNGEFYETSGPEATKKIEAFAASVPYIPILAKQCEEVAKRRGYIFLHDGRRCRFPKDQFGNYADAYTAGNRLAQGNAAVMTKYACIALEAEGFDPFLTVHDEFDGEEDDPDRVRKVGEIMAHALELSVPNHVEMSMGDSYGELEKLSAA